MDVGVLALSAQLPARGLGRAFDRRFARRGHMPGIEGQNGGPSLPRARAADLGSSPEPSIRSVSTLPTRGRIALSCTGVGSGVLVYGLRLARETCSLNHLGILTMSQCPSWSHSDPLIPSAASAGFDMAGQSDGYKSGPFVLACHDLYHRKLLLTTGWTIYSIG